jgi:hypothetical protein
VPTTENRFAGQVAADARSSFRTLIALNWG